MRRIPMSTFNAVFARCGRSGTGGRLRHSKTIAPCRPSITGSTRWGGTPVWARDGRTSRLSARRPEPSFFAAMVLGARSAELVMENFILKIRADSL